MLATSVDADSIYAVPSEIDDAASAVAQLCGALGDCTARDRQTLTERLRRDARRSPTCGARSRRTRPRRVADLKLDGIGFLKESRRFYPKKELAAHVLGYVGTDNKGLSGIESAYDKQIRGEGRRAS